MRNIFEEIIKIIENCIKTNASFTLPTFNACETVESDYKTGGATLYGVKYVITNGHQKIVVSYESKDQCRTFQIKPDKNIVIVQYFNDKGELVSNYSETWEDN